MRPRRTPTSNDVVKAGSAAVNDLPVRRGVGFPGLAPDDPCAALPYVVAVYSLDDAERAAIATGSNVELALFGDLIPPMSLAVTDEQAAGDPPLEEGEHLWTRLGADVVNDVLAGLALQAQALEGLDGFGPRHPRVRELRDTAAELSRARAVLEARARARGGDA